MSKESKLFTSEELMMKKMRRKKITKLKLKSRARKVKATLSKNQRSSR
jgi:hypothetical protein